MWKALVKWIGQVLVQAAAKKVTERLSGEDTPKPSSPSSAS